MRNSRLSLLTLALALTALTVVKLETVLACPFCSAPSLTFSEQLAGADAAVLVQWVSAKKGEKDKPGSTTYEITQLLRSPKGDELKKEARIDLARFRTAKKGDLFLLLGTKGKKLEWGSPLEVTETSFNYIAQAPSPETNARKRLAYFVKFLEFPDETIANDAYAEFANAPYKDIKLLRKELPRTKIAKWVKSDKTPVTRTGLYGLLLGLCGNEGDQALMKKKITESSGEFRLGMDGVMGGYLLLAGEEGLKVIEESKLVPRDKKIPFSETYAAMQALRFVWRYGDEEDISKDRLRQSMRILLDRPELADLVIADLSRWKDWVVLERLMAMYDNEEFSVPSVKRAIVRYLLTCAKDVPSGDNVKPPKHAIDAQKALTVLRKKDPKTVKEAERFFLIR